MGWAVFRCTREVAEAIVVADQQRLREAERIRLAAAGLDGDQLIRETAAEPSAEAALSCWLKCRPGKTIMDSGRRCFSVRRSAG